jgi:hypothetical protein
MPSRPDNNSITFLTSIPAGSLLRSLKVKSLNDFKKLVQTKPGADTDKGGALILQGLIIKKFKTQVPKGTPDLAKRLSYFRSAHFIHNFLTDIPARDKWDENKLETSYTAWFNTLFSVSFSDWRESKLIVTGNQEQCKRALRENVKVNTNPRCYLCGDLFLKKHDSKECEHVLPVVSALSHLWLTQERIDRYSQGEQNALRLEYDWAHRCCNQIKSNYEFVILNYKGQRYDINTPLVETYYSHLRESNKYDCSKIALKNIPPKVREGLHARLRGITNIINNNINSLGSLDLYHLLIKFKVLSAFTDDVFLEALTGNGEAVVKKTIDPEVIKASRERNAQREREIKEAEDAFFAYKKASVERRRLKYESSENPTTPANNTSTVASETGILVGGEGNNSNMDEQENADIIDNQFAPFDEDLSFPLGFLRLIGMPEGESLEMIDEYIINYILTSPRYEPNEEQIDAFLIEQGVMSPTQNVKFTLYNKVPNFKFSLLKSPRKGDFAPPATPNLHIRGKRRANNYNELSENYTNNRSGMTPDKRIRLQSSNELMSVEGGRRSRNIRKKAKVKRTTKKVRR